MLQLIRKHQYSIMLLVTVIVIFAFAWWGDFFGRGEQTPGRGQPFVAVGGKTYTRSQISKVAAGSQVAQRLFPFHVFQVERAYRRYDLPGLDYALNTLALRDRAVEYGIAVSPEEIDSRMLSMPDFQTPEARQRTYRIYGSLGLGEGDIAQIVADVITMEKLTDLISAGLLASESGAEYDYASRYQTIFSSFAKIAQVKPEDVEISEDELMEAYEAQKAGLKTDRQVSIRYVFFEAPAEEPVGGIPSIPNIPIPGLDPAPSNGADQEVDPKGKEEKPDGPKDTSGEETSGDGSEGVEGDEGAGGDPGADSKAKELKVDAASPAEDGADAPKEGAEVAEEPAKPDTAAGNDAPAADAAADEETKALSFEDRIRLKKEFNALVDQFWGEFFQDGQYVPGVDFAEIAKDERYGLEVVETALFSLSEPPEDISDQQMLITAAISKSLEPPISDPVAASGDKKGYFIFEILKVEEPREKTFEEAKADLEEALRRDKAAESTLVAADETREKVATAVEAGKSFAEAAKAAGLTAEEIKPFSPSEPPPEPINLRQMLPALIDAVPGEVSEPVDLFDGKALVYVAKRELWKRANSETLKDGVRSNSVSSQGFNLLGDWFERVRGAWNEKIL